MTFEELHAVAKGIAIPRSSEERRIKWCDQSLCLGIAREATGAYEIFLRGTPLAVRERGLRRHVRFDEWSTSESNVFHASRIVFPADTHYCAIAAFVAEELYRCGLLVDMQSAFTAAEPVLELALRRSVLAEETVVGLIGELCFLTILLSSGATLESRVRAMNSWHGYERAVRDFVFPGVALEIKTTRGQRSTHQISSIGQVDADRMPDGCPVEGLFLVSFGVDELGPEDEPVGGLSVPDLVDGLLELLRDPDNANGDTEAQHILLDRIAHYGAGYGGYDHGTMKSWPAFQARYRQRFIRIYDLNDSRIEVIRRTTVAECTHVVVESINYAVDLPDVVRGDMNPIVDPFEFAARLVT